MAVSMMLLLVCLIMMATYMCIYCKNRHLPPGPYGLPIIGFLPFLGKNPIMTLTNLKKKYGNVVSISLGPKLIVILNDWNALKEALITHGNIFSGRFHLPLSKALFNDKDIIFAEGLRWKEHRNFAIHILREFGFGRSSLESHIMYEVDKLTVYLNENAGKPIEINALFFVPVLNIIWKMTSSKRFETMDEFTLDFKKMMRYITHLGATNIMNCLPFLKPILSKSSRMHSELWTTAKKLQEFFEKEVKSHETNFQENNLRDFIDVYLAEIYKRREKNGKEIPPYDREHLIGTIADLFVAGSETVDSTLCWAVLHMSNEPNMQRKVQEELDRVVAKDSYLSVSSKALAPYTEATLLEIQRHPTLLPLSVAHKVTQDTTLLGYKIPKGTLVFPNIYSVHHELEFWGDPETFRPERFLDETGTKVINHERLVPFSIGPRACLGEPIGKMELHLFFTSLLRRFTFEAIPGKPKPSMVPIPGSMLKTRPFYLIVKPRK